MRFIKGGGAFHLCIGTKKILDAFEMHFPRVLKMQVKMGQNILWLYVNKEQGICNLCNVNIKSCYNVSICKPLHFKLSKSTMGDAWFMGFLTWLINNLDMSST